MRFRETPLKGAWLVEIEPHPDERGYFTRLWCARQFEQQGLPSRIVQASLSRNLRKGTVRGMHMQLPPSQEGKLVSCVKGRIYDVIVDARPDSPTYLHHFGAELAAERHDALYVPPGMLHGFQTLEDDTEVFYQMTDFHAPELAIGARWNDPAFGIRWPLGGDLVMNDRDRNYPNFDREAHERAYRAASAARSS